MTNLSDKFLAVLAATRIGSAMGAAVECWPARKIRDTHGELDRLLEYEHYRNGWRRMPGTTEDGIERQKLMFEALRSKIGRSRDMAAKLAARLA